MKSETLPVFVQPLASENLFQLLGTWFGGFGKFKPCVRWYRGADHLVYLIRDCSYEADSFGSYFAALLFKGMIVGVSLEPFSGLVADIRKTYPGIGRDGRDFPLWSIIQRLTTEE